MISDPVRTTQFAPIDVIGAWPRQDEIRGRRHVNETWDIPLEIALAISQTKLKAYILQCYAAGKIERDCRAFIRGDRLFGVVKFIGSDNWLVIDLATQAMASQSSKQRGARAA